MADALVDLDVVEEWKWMGTPIWSHDGIICTGESYKNVVKLTFAKGAALKDPARLFNSSLDGNTRRAIDIHEREEVDGSAFKALVRQAVALNSSGKSKLSKKARSALEHFNGPDPRSTRPRPPQAGRLKDGGHGSRRVHVHGKPAAPEPPDGIADRHHQPGDPAGARITEREHASGMASGGSEEPAIVSIAANHPIHEVAQVARRISTGSARVALSAGATHAASPAASSTASAMTSEITSTKNTS